MAKFRKKPVVVEAMRVSEIIAASLAHGDYVPGWFAEARRVGGAVVYSDWISVPTLEGMMRAGKEDWIIQGVAGEIYPCKPDIFAATYEPAEQALPSLQAQNAELMKVVEAANVWRAWKGDAESNVQEYEIIKALDALPRSSAAQKP